MGQDSAGRDDEASPFTKYQVSQELMELGNDPIFLHCLPAYRGHAATAKARNAPASEASAPPHHRHPPPRRPGFPRRPSPSGSAPPLPRSTAPRRHYTPLRRCTLRSHVGRGTSGEGCLAQIARASHNPRRVGVGPGTDGEGWSREKCGCQRRRDRRDELSGPAILASAPSAWPRPRHLTGGGS
ncbi:hypothetical protein [Brevibacterium sp. S22]|uniref:hypothetical protein n=1 Tax=Brevibacterium sp. S22 TaxID=2483794 RepID=UPI003211CE2B